MVERVPSMDELWTDSFSVKVLRRIVLSTSSIPDTLPFRLPREITASRDLLWMSLPIVRSNGSSLGWKYEYMPSVLNLTDPAISEVKSFSSM